MWRSRQNSQKSWQSAPTVFHHRQPLNFKSVPVVLHGGSSCVKPPEVDTSEKECIEILFADNQNLASIRSIKISLVCIQVPRNSLDYTDSSDQEWCSRKVFCVYIYWKSLGWAFSVGHFLKLCHNKSLNKKEVNKDKLQINNKKLSNAAEWSSRVNTVGLLIAFLREEVLRTSPLLS